MSVDRPNPRPDLRLDPRLDPAVQAILDKIELGQDEEEDKYYVDPAEIPDGMSYEWKRQSTFGKEDPSYQVNLARMGWTPVPADRHATMMPEGFSGKHVERDGMVLMERASVSTDAVRARDLRKARAQVRDNEVQLGQSPGITLGPPKAQVKTSIHAPIPIPD